MFAIIRIALTGVFGILALGLCGDVKPSENGTDVVLMNPDGKLIVRNSHRDYALEARELREREYRARLSHFMLEPNERPADKGPAKKKTLK